MDDLALDLAFPPPVEETPIRLSYSSISTYELCPLQYKFRYVDGRPGKRTPALGFGESLHEALRLFHAQPVPVAPSLDATLGYLAEVWDPSVYSGEEEERAYRAHARQVLTAYHRDNAPGFRMAVALEQRFAIDVEGVRVSGVIDRMDRHPDGSYEIIDYKTSRRLRRDRSPAVDLLPRGVGGLGHPPVAAHAVLLASRPADDGHANGRRPRRHPRPHPRGRGGDPLRALPRSGESALRLV